MSGSLHAPSNEYIIAFICFLWTGTSDGPEGKNPLFLTMSAEEKQPIYQSSNIFICKLWVASN